MSAAASGPGASGTGPDDDAYELVRRLAAETERRQRAEAQAQTATATAEAETARAALAGLRATAVESIASVRARDRVDRMAALHDGLRALRADLDGLRAAVTAALAAGAAPPTAPSRVAAERVPAAGVDPELVRGARQMLAHGRLDTADEVIRGLEQAAARLRAQADPPAVD